MRQWPLLTADESPVQVAETAMGGLARPSLLRADASYDLELDIEGGWQVYGHQVPGGVVPRPGACPTCGRCHSFGSTTMDTTAGTNALHALHAERRDDE